MSRLFIAVDLPSSVREELIDVLSSFEGFKLKLVSPELIHITLKFLGEVSDDLVLDIASSLDGIECIPFNANIKGVGVFPNLRSPRVVWLGAEGNFKQLHEDVETSLSKLSFDKDKREFTAHATLARIKFMPKEQMKGFLDVLDKLKEVDLGEIRVDKVLLKKSTLTPDGPVYQTIHEVLLGHS
ncbi:RNA 2',3'-cyclic phosphodiesterase [Methanococcoides sp. SA1]|nr:RNA 2',3'-cyclic phosphodiesterase [Methanococcoides sp. SA1]